MTIKFLSIAICVALSINYAHASNKIDLSGTWSFQLDPNKKLSSKSKFTDSIQLPSTTDVEKKGNFNQLIIGTADKEVFDGWNIIAGLDDDEKSAKSESKQSSIFNLTRQYQYEGLAWYSREIDIPQSWENKNIFLNLERTKLTEIYIDNRKKGGSDILSAPQKFNLGKLKAGKHTLTISVDNNKKYWGFNSHMIDGPGTNYNGIIGDISLEAFDDVFISRIKATPDVDNSKFIIEVALQATLPQVTDRKKVTLTLKASPVKAIDNIETPTNSIESKAVYEFQASNAGNLKNFDIAIINAQLWDEYNPTYYKITASLKFDDKEQIVQIDSGLRDFKAIGHQLSVNGKTIFLRGKHDALTFPLTGHPPTNLDDWLAFFNICKDYGINHIRYHTSCPPPMAFKAANMLGMYISIDAVAWKSFPDILTNKEMFVVRDSTALLNAYSSNPSFVMFNMGNETQGSRENLSIIRDMLKTRAKHILFSTGANSQLRTQHQADGDDFWVTFRTYQEPTQSDTSGNTRASCSYVNLPLGAVQTGEFSGTFGDFSRSLQYSTVPVIGHETGQYLFYPNFDEIEKYTGVLKPYVIEIFKQRLKDDKLFDNWKNYYLSAGKLAMICYKREIELALGTKDFAGFQLLDLQDFPDQAWAIVGPLDVFMQPKPNLVSDESWREFCSEIVPLAKFEKYCYKVGETLDLRIDISQFSGEDIDDALVKIDILEDGKKSVFNKTFNIEKIERGNLAENVVNLKIDTTKFASPYRYEIQIQVDKNGSKSIKPLGKNKYNIWVYPTEPIVEQNQPIAISDNLQDALTKANNGERVLLFIDSKKYQKATIKGSFASIFWTWAIFESVARKASKEPEPGTMGICIDEKHKAFANFPTSHHSDWQWFNLINNARVINLNNLKDKKDVSIIEMVDNIWRRNFLSLAFEAKVGNGSILICSIPLKTLSQEYIEAKQLLVSLKNYISSEDFAPKHKLTEDEILSIFKN